MLAFVTTIGKLLVMGGSKKLLQILVLENIISVKKEDKHLNHLITIDT